MKNEEKDITFFLFQRFYQFGTQTQQGLDELFMCNKQTACLSNVYSRVSDEKVEKGQRDLKTHPFLTLYLTFGYWCDLTIIVTLTQHY